MDFMGKCTRCGSDCCIFKDNLGFAFIGIGDARKIKKAIKWDYCYFLDFSPLKKKTVAALRTCDPSLEGALRFSQLDNKGRILRLKTRRGARCIFLNESNGCDIYSHRPNVCRIYPFWAIRLISNRIKVIEHDPLPICQIIAEAADAVKSLSRTEILKIKRVFKSIEKENSLYQKHKHKLPACSRGLWR